MENADLYKSLSDAMIAAAKAAGQQLLVDFRNRQNLKVDSKEVSDFVSEADKKSDVTIRDKLGQAFPDFGFLTEEGADKSDTHPRRFIADSLDGTTNFLSGYDQWCVSIAAEINGEIVAGVIYAPKLNKLYWAIRGEGAFLDAGDGTERLYVSTRTDLNKSQVGVGLPFKGRPKPGALKMLARCSKAVAGIHSVRSVAMECAYVAQGIFDGYAHVYHGGGPWDFAAGKLLVEEAGGIVLAPDGGRNPVYKNHIICVTPSLGSDLWRVFMNTPVPAAITDRALRVRYPHTLQ